MQEASSVSRMAPCLRITRQQPVGRRFHVRVDLAGELMGNGAGAAPEQAQLVLDGGQGRFGGIVSAAGDPRASAGLLMATILESSAP